MGSVSLCLLVVSWFRLMVRGYSSHGPGLLSVRNLCVSLMVRSHGPALMVRGYFPLRVPWSGVLLSHGQSLLVLCWYRATLRATPQPNHRLDRGFSPEYTYVSPPSPFTTSYHCVGDLPSSTRAAVCVHPSNGDDSLERLGSSSKPLSNKDHRFRDHGKSYPSNCFSGGSRDD